MRSETTSEEFFEAKYQEAADPWNFAGSRYEQDRYGTIVAALGNRRFRRAFEPGCSIGVLTERLARHCERVEAMDIAATAVCRARERCAHLSNVAISHGALPEDLPAGRFDLIVFSEIGYYLETAALAGMCERLAQMLEPGGVFLAVHWLGTSPDHVLTGQQVHEAIGGTRGLARVNSKKYDGFWMEEWAGTLAF
jgi:protein-L-isoaspartate O-methyltransferase